MSITVKPLVWKAAPYEGDSLAIDHYAVYLGGWLYLIKQRSHGIYLYRGQDHLAGTIYPEEGSGTHAPTYTTLAAAQDAAQVEWNTFIREAIDLP